MPSKAILSDPGYTPKRHDLAQVLEWFLFEPDDVAKLAERALLNAGAPVAELAVPQLDQVPASPRARLARLLGRLAQRTRQTSTASVLIRVLDDPEPRVARTAIVALGKLPSELAHTIGADRALSERLARFAEPERRAAIEALGKIGGEVAGAALRERVPEGALESQLFDRAKLRLDRASAVLDESDRVLLDVALGEPFTLAIVHRRGLSDIVAAQLGDLGPGLLDGFERRVLRNYTGDLGSLFRVRSMLTPALVLPLEPQHQDPDWTEQIATSLCQPHVLRALERLTSTRPRLRLSFPKEGHQRSLLWAISELVATKTDRVSVNPKAALWEVQLERGREPRLYLVPKRYEDPRFTYRMREISGASHPSIAAALVDVLDVRESDVIWDPFVGSGLELVECGLRGKYRELIGTDNNPRALEAAQANVNAAGLSRVRLLNADARTAQLSQVTGIVTNPPLGIRHQRDGLLEPLLMEFLANARHNLAPGGRLVWLSPLPQKTAERARRLGFDVTRRGPVDVGGLTPELQILRVPELAREGEGRPHTSSGCGRDRSVREGPAEAQRVDGVLPQKRRRVVEARPQSDAEPSGDATRRSVKRRGRS